MFGNFALSDLIAYHCLSIDVECRNELRNGIIVSERDYVSALCNRIRDRLTNLYGMNCHAQTVNNMAETSLGIDGVVVFRYNQEIKVGIFEAKRPQLLFPNYSWDELTPRNASHFSEQITKQHVWQDTIAIWEIFFNEGVQGYLSPPYEVFGSSCIWHNNAYQFMHDNNLIFNKWRTTDLNKLLSKSCTSLYSIIYEILGCKAGRVFNLDTSISSIVINNPINDAILTIPLPLEPGVNINRGIQTFLTRNNFYEYLYIDLNSSLLEELSF